MAFEYLIVFTYFTAFCRSMTCSFPNNITMIYFNIVFPIYWMSINNAFLNTLNSQNSIKSNKKVQIIKQSTYYSINSILSSYQNYYIIKLDIQDLNYQHYKNSLCDLEKLLRYSSKLYEASNCMPQEYCKIKVA